MKKALFALLLAVFLVAFVVPPGHADEYNSALKAARSAHKPLLLYFFSKTCYYCALMDKDTLSDKDVSAMLKRDFVFLRIDTDKSVELSTLYRIEGTPSSWFLDSTGKRILEAPGYIQKPLYKKVLEYVRGGYYASMTIESYLKR